MAEKYAGKGLVVLAVDVRGDETAEEIRSWASQNGLKQTFLPDGSRVARSYGIRVAPTNILVDARGRIVSRTEGFDDETFAALESQVRRLLGSSG